MNSTELLTEGRTTLEWLEMGKDEHKLFLRTEQGGICPSCEKELPEKPRMFDLARQPDHQYSKNDYRDKSICYVKHAVCHQATDHGNVPWFNALAGLVQHREEIQRMRIRLANRVLAIEREMDDPLLMPGTMKGIGPRLLKMEKALTKDIKDWMKSSPGIVQQALAVKGVGPTTIARIMAEIDIHRAEYASSLHKFAGFAPGFDKTEKGEKENGRRARGPKRPYNARLRVACRVQGDSFLKAVGSEYSLWYYRYREVDETKNPDLTKAHYNNRAKRKMMKLFLSHLYERWRMLEGLPVNRHYAAAHLEHNGYISPEECGWPPLD